MKNEITQVFFICPCGKRLAVDMRFEGDFILPINFKWHRDGNQVYCTECAKDIEKFNENNEQENDMYDFHSSQGGIKNRPDKENRILTALKEYGPLSVTKISAITMLPRSTTAQRLRTLQREKKVKVENRLWSIAA